MRTRLITAALLASVGASCAPASSGEPVVRTADELRLASTQLSAAGTTLTLEVEAWRSFQPITGNVGDPLIAILRVQAGDSARVPGAIAVDAVYLMRGTDVLRVEAREEQPRAANARAVEFVVRDGPRWSAGDSIDVVVALAGLGGPSVLLRAPRVAIARVD